MKKLFSNMDWLKGLILFCVVASIGLGVWNWMLTKQVDETKKAWSRTKKDYVQIVALTKQIQTLYEALDQQGDLDVDELIYFQKQLTEMAKIRGETYKFGDINPKEVTIAGSGNRKRSTKVLQRVVPIRFQTGKNRKYVSREQVFVACYNAEKNSKRWTLQTLRLKARELFEGNGPKKGYPEELSDEWMIEKLEFVSREPVSKSKS